MDALQLFFAQNGLWIISGGAVAAIVVAVLIVASLRREAQTDQMLIRYGIGEPKTYVGTGSYVIPGFIHIKTMNIPIWDVEWSDEKVKSADYITLGINYLAQCYVDPTNKEHRNKVAQLFLSSNTEEIKKKIKAVLETGSREIVAKTTAKDLHADRDGFIEEVNKIVRKDLAAIGVSILVIGIKDLSSPDGYFDSLGAREVAEADKQARIDKANAERDAAIQEHNARLQSENVRLANEEAVIEKDEALRVRRVQMEETEAKRRAEKDRDVAEIQAEAARMQAQTAVVQAEKAKEAALITAQSEREITVEAAQADRQAREESAMAALVEAQRRAEADLAEEVAKADGIRAQRQAEADGVLAGHKAQAEGTRLNKTAEAEGEHALAEAKERLADALAAQGQISVIHQLASEQINADRDARIAFANAIGMIAQKWEITQITGGNGSNGSSGNIINDMFRDLPLLMRENQLVSEGLNTPSIVDMMNAVAEMAGIDKRFSVSDDKETIVLESDSTVEE